MRYSFYSFEGAAEQAASPAAKVALFLQAAAHWRGVVASRRILARSYGAPKGFDAKQASEAFFYATNALREARRARGFAG